METRDKIEKIMQYGIEIDKIIHNKHHQMAQQSNLTLDQFHLLIYLSHRDKAPTIGQLAERFNNAQNTISEKISRMEEKGLINKIKDEKDRRVSRVIITEEGNRLIGSIRQKAGREFIYDSLSKMERSLIENLFFSLEDLVKKLKDHKGVE